MISKTGIHALAALAALARLGAGAYAGSGDIAREIGAPRNYLGKLLKTLADAGFLESQKGKGGGFRMARDPAAIPLIKVIEKIERIDRWSGCLMGRGRCSESLSKNRPAAILRRPSGAEEGEAACRGRRGGGSASPTIRGTQGLSNSCSGPERNPCPAHERWAKVREAYLDFLESTSIADLAAGGRWESEEQGSALVKTKKEGDRR